jgi:endo-1,4-beta-xylanase
MTTLLLAAAVHVSPAEARCQGCVATPPPSPVVPPGTCQGCSPVRPTPAVTLRAVAAGAGLTIGAAAQPQHFVDPRYGATLAQFSGLTTENALKMGPLRPSPDVFDFGPADALLDFAANHGLEVHGHTLVYHDQLPAWLTGATWTRAQLLAILEHHIRTVVERYRGRIASWDVVNEAVDDAGGLRRSIWLEVIGPEYLDLAFRWAHEADPAATLYLNDYGAEGLGLKSDAVYSLAHSLRGRGVPLHGVGLQMHTELWARPLPSHVLANLQRLAAIPVLIHVSEMDVRVPTPATASALDAQAGVYADMLRACLAVEACTRFTAWGFTDAHSWIPTFFPGWGDALLFDGDYAPKPAYHAVIDVLRGAGE